MKIDISTENLPSWVADERSKSALGSERLCCTNRSEAVLLLSQTDLAYGDGMGYAKRCEAFQDRGADLDLGNQAIKVTRPEALTE